jgi:hypothetical protein
MVVSGDAQWSMARMLKELGKLARKYVSQASKLDWY